MDLTATICGRRYNRIEAILKDMKTVVVGFLGSKLDAGTRGKRWDGWRPTVSVCQHEDLLVDRFELLYPPQAEALAEVVKRDIASVSPETEVRLTPFDVPNAWDFEVVYETLHDWTRSARFDPENENYLVHITTGTHVQQIVLFLLTESRHIPGRLIQTSPPRRGSDQVAGIYALIDLDLERYDRLAQRFEREREEGESLLKSGIATRNAGFNALIERIERVAARTHDPIVLTGPTGAGKSQLARRIYELKLARNQIRGQFVELNCATLHGTSAMSALFGHTKGAFTGATGERKGLLRAADGGVIFLDEIGELGLDEQAMLLRAVEEKKFLPFGSDQEVTSNFQLFVGTHRDLEADVRSGRFREDLLARINLWTFRLPGLSERREDIEPNFEFELEQAASRTGRRVTCNSAARESFLRFATSSTAAWNANFRDLNAAVVRMATLCEGGRIGKRDVDEEIGRLRSQWGAPAPENAHGELLLNVLGEERYAQLDRFDAVQLAEVIHVCRESDSLADAGRRLFQVSRTQRSSRNDSDRLRKYLLRFDLDWRAVNAPVRDAREAPRAQPGSNPR